MHSYSVGSAENPLDHPAIQVANVMFLYWWEYLGVPDRLVQTLLMDQVYLTLTQALDSQFGGSPFGPAGTGASIDSHVVEVLSDNPSQVKLNPSKPLVFKLVDLF